MHGPHKLPNAQQSPVLSAASRASAASGAPSWGSPLTDWRSRALWLAGVSVLGLAAGLMATHNVASPHATSSSGNSASGSTGLAEKPPSARGDMPPRGAVHSDLEATRPFTAPRVDLGDAFDPAPQPVAAARGEALAPSGADQRQRGSDREQGSDRNNAEPLSFPTLQFPGEAEPARATRTWQDRPQAQQGAQRPGSRVSGNGGIAFLDAEGTARLDGTLQLPLPSESQRPPRFASQSSTQLR